MRYLLDTDICIEVIRRREFISSRVRDQAPGDLVIASMTVAELRYGALNSSAPDRALAAVDAFLSAPFTILPFDEPAARQHAQARLALRSQPIGERDLVIAATALAGGHTVVTGNHQHFERVPGLQVEDWTVE